MSGRTDTALHSIVCREGVLKSSIAEGRNYKCQFCSKVQPTIVRDLQTAWNWVQSHKDMFIEEVTEPAFLRMSSNEQEDALKKVLGGHFPEDRYNFLFVFQPFKDMETFLSTCVDEYGLRVNAMVKKE